MLHSHFILLKNVLGKRKKQQKSSFQFYSQNSSFLPIRLPIVSLKYLFFLKGAFTDKDLQSMGDVTHNFSLLL